MLQGTKVSKKFVLPVSLQKTVPPHHTKHETQGQFIQGVVIHLRDRRPAPAEIID